MSRRTRLPSNMDWVRLNAVGIVGVMLRKRKLRNRRRRRSRNGGDRGRNAGSGWTKGQSGCEIMGWWRVAGELNDGIAGFPVDAL